MSVNTNATYKQLTCDMCIGRKTITYCKYSKIGYEKDVTLSIKPVSLDISYCTVINYTLKNLLNIMANS